MWAYRLGPGSDEFRLLKNVSVVRGRLLKAETASTSEFQFSNDLQVAHDMARAIGWDGYSMVEDQCFALPSLDGLLYAFVITQATGGQRYIISPVKLDYLQESVDWDAHTSIDEVRQAKGALSGTLNPDPPIKVGEWMRSRKGNMYTNINGAVVTIFSTDNGFKAVIGAPSGDLKVYTKLFKTELEAAQYVSQAKNFYTLVRSATTGVSNDNPFADVKWEADDADIPF